MTEIDMSVNALGQIVKNVDTEKINAFLNKNVPDKKSSENNNLEPI